MQNTTRLIERYLNYNYWSYETKVLVIFPQVPENYEILLRKLSAVGLFNIALWWPHGDSGCIVAYHNPFPQEHSTVSLLWNPTDWKDAFPNKAGNLYGHQMNLLAIVRPPHIIFRDCEVYGTDLFLFKIMLDRWNATYRISTRHWAKQDPSTAITNLLINRYPFYSNLNHDYVILPANDQDQARIMVKYKYGGNTYVAFGSSFNNKYSLLIIATFFSYFILHYCFFHRKSDIICMFGCSLIPVALRQPTCIRLVTWKERLFLASALWFAFFTVGAFECQFTSSLLANFPQDKIRTVTELEQSNLRVFSDFFVTALLHQDRYNLSDAFLARIEVTDKLPWADSFGRLEFAFVVGMSTNEFFFKSALNRDSNGNERFYLLDHVITTTPFVYQFPHHSPYLTDFQATQGRIQEAGLSRSWQTKTLQKKIWNVWHSFTDGSGEEARRSTNLNRSYVVCTVLVIGWTVAVLVLVAELLWKR